MERTSRVDSRIKRLQLEIQKGNNEAENEFLDYLKVKGAPLIEKIPDDEVYDLVTIIYREKKPCSNVVLIPPVGMRKLENCIMDKIEGTSIWYIAYKVEKDIRFSYQFSPNDPLDKDWNRRWRHVEGDEFNKNNLNFKGKINNKYKLVPYVIMEKSKPQIWIKENKESVEGSIEHLKIHSDILDEDRDITIYKPADFDIKKEYGLLVLNDGFEYINILSALNVLDNLISSKKIRPLIAVFIDSTLKRGEDMKCSDIYADFIVNEVVKFVKDKYKISKLSADNIIGGYSLGGLQAAYTALKHSEVFGNVLSQSGSYWYKRDDYNNDNVTWMSSQFKKLDKMPIKFYINVGSIEPKVSMIDTNVEFKNTLISLGYEVDFEEFGSGHDYLCWGETLAEGLIKLVGID
ncbi:MAG: alpha/beta hydrolase-fold protein [Clostridiaceae bacterium]|nr:alpha/beta hydrolase-fold protein [Clostridiaceae bacterium]